MLFFGLVAWQPHLQNQKNVQCLLILNSFNPKYSAWMSLCFAVVVEESKPLHMLSLVT